MITIMQIHLNEPPGKYFLLKLYAFWKKGIKKATSFSSHEILSENIIYRVIKCNLFKGDVLLFLTGQEEIDTACEVLFERYSFSLIFKKTLR